jgi:phage tail sheath gpL-like
MATTGRLNEENASIAKFLAQIQISPSSRLLIATTGHAVCAIEIDIDPASGLID